MSIKVALVEAPRKGRSTTFGSGRRGILSQAIVWACRENAWVDR